MFPGWNQCYVKDRVHSFTRMKSLVRLGRAVPLSQLKYSALLNDQYLCFVTVLGLTNSEERMHQLYYANYKVSQPSKVFPSVNITVLGLTEILMLTSKECISCILPTIKLVAHTNTRIGTKTRGKTRNFNTHVKGHNSMKDG